MKSTGVVRRVDDLGRIVIPKEIRKVLHIREGEELEIFVENETVCLKKFSKMVDMMNISKKLSDVVSSLLGKTVLICDCERFITGSGEKNKMYLNKEISKNLYDLILCGNKVVKKEISNIFLLSNDEEKYSYVICPINYYGDNIGAIILLSYNSDISEFDVRICDMISQFLAKYIED